MCWRLSALLLAACAGSASASDVIDLGTVGFDEKVKAGDWLVEFYA